MKRILPIIFAVLLVALIAAGSVTTGTMRRSSNPAEAAVLEMYDHIKAHDLDAAFALVAPSSNITKGAFASDIYGSDASLRTYSQLQKVDTKVLRSTDTDADIRANIEWATAVGVQHEFRDLKVLNENGKWRIYWPAPQQANLPPQVIPVNYLRWDVIHRGSGDDWGAQNVEAPKVRIVSMNAVERDDSVIVMGEVVNEDTVPGFVDVSAVLIGQDGNTIGSETSFDKTSHVLLPKEVSPFRIDFPGIKLAQVKSVRMNPTSLLVPASADPVIGVLHQRIEKDSRGHSVLRGELINESGETVNIPHVIATFYDASGKVIWVSDGYVDHALLPQVSEPFSVEVRDDLGAAVNSYRVTVNNYTRDRVQG